MSEIAGFVRVFKCTTCGGKLAYSPGTQTLVCEYCGATNTVKDEAGEIEELDLPSFLASLPKEESFAAESVKCAKCGAEQKLPEDCFAATCTYCAGPIVSKDYAGRRVLPKSLVPFKLDHAKARDAFRSWLRWRWLAPGDLKRYAQSDAALTGTYLPFWTYDCSTATDYQGQRGTKKDKSTSWVAVSGHVDKAFDDVVVLASRSVPDSLQAALQRWDTKELVPYQPDFVSGFRGEAYRIGLAQGLPIAKEAIEARIRSAIRAEIGGDDQRIDSMRTEYHDLTFKHVLMPAWISAYRYKDRTYRFIVNAQTGETEGESPLSWWKVAMLVILGLFILYLWAKSQ